MPTEPIWTKEREDALAEWAWEYSYSAYNNRYILSTIYAAAKNHPELVLAHAWRDLLALGENVNL
jgi:hypothetical protein